MHTGLAAVTVALTVLPLVHENDRQDAPILFIGFFFWILISLIIGVAQILWQAYRKRPRRIHPAIIVAPASFLLLLPAYSIGEPLARQVSSFCEMYYKEVVAVSVPNGDAAPVTLIATGPGNQSGFSLDTVRLSTEGLDTLYILLPDFENCCDERRPVTVESLTSHLSQKYPPGVAGELGALLFSNLTTLNRVYRFEDERLKAGERRIFVNDDSLLSVVCALCLILALLLAIPLSYDFVRRGQQRESD